MIYSHIVRSSGGWGFSSQVAVTQIVFALPYCDMCCIHWSQCSRWASKCEFFQMPFCLFIISLQDHKLLKQSGPSKLMKSWKKFLWTSFKTEVASLTFSKVKRHPKYLNELRMSNCKGLDGLCLASCDNHIINKFDCSHSSTTTSILSYGNLNCWWNFFMNCSSSRSWSCT